MKSVAAVLLFLFGFLARPALAGEGYSLDHRPTVVFKGGVERMTPYPQGKRSTSVWTSDARFRDSQLDLHLEDGILRPRQRRRHLPAASRQLRPRLPARDPAAGAVRGADRWPPSSTGIIVPSRSPEASSRRSAPAIRASEVTGRPSELLVPNDDLR